MWTLWLMAAVACGLKGSLPPPNTAASFSVINTLWRSRAGYKVTQTGAGPEGASAVATAIYNESLLDLGWDYLSVRSLPASTSEDYDAGFIEGYVTYRRMTQVIPYQNYSTDAREDAWIDEHIEYIQTQVAKRSEPFWATVGRLLQRMDGIAAGYTQRSAEVGGYALTFRQIFRLNFNDEIGDVRIALGTGENSLPQHCSALVKLTSDELFTSHDTWAHYIHMVRQFKDYNIGGTIVSFTTTAGFVASGDDFYVTSNQLAVQETTNDYFNKSLAEEYVRPNTVSEFLRVMAANVLATDGRSWVKYFAMNNSGTYCNQYMVVDYKLYTRGDKPESLRDGLLWIAEQIPGNVTSADVTDVLRKTTYWASYNIPYFQNIYDVSGFREQEEEYGTFFSYSNYARPEIFRRNHTMVTDLDSMRAMMRYNGYQHDPLSEIPNCTTCDGERSPMLSIASRGDLVSPSAKLPPEPMKDYYAHAPFGAIDSKITSASMMTNLQVTLVVGPTTEGQPPFSWAGYPMPAPEGAPAVFRFDWIFMNAIAPPAPLPPNLHRLEVALAAGMGVIVGTVVLVMCVAACRTLTKKAPTPDPLIS